MLRRRDYERRREGLNRGATLGIVWLVSRRTDSSHACISKPI